MIFFESKSDLKCEEKLSIDGYHYDLVSYHIYIMYEAGLINGEPIRSKGGRIYDVLPFRLTWEGREFLDSIRGGRWEKITSIIKEKGGDFTFEVIKKIAFKIAENQLLNKI